MVCRRRCTGAGARPVNDRGSIVNEERRAAPNGRRDVRIELEVWDDMTRLNHPLNVTPFLDDVTIAYIPEGGMRVIDYRER